MQNSPIQFRIYPQAGASIQRDLDLGELQALFQASAFWAQDRSLEDLALAIAHSKPISTAWEVRAGADSGDVLLRRDRLVGFARATADGVYRGTIWDVVVHPEFQSQGIGRKLVETLLSHPHLSRVERVYLMTTHQEKFYERVGFERNSSTTMVIYNRPLELSAELPFMSQTSELAGQETLARDGLDGAQDGLDGKEGFERAGFENVGFERAGFEKDALDISGPSA